MYKKKKQNLKIDYVVSLCSFLSCQDNTRRGKKKTIRDTFAVTVILRRVVVVVFIWNINNNNSNDNNNNNSGLIVCGIQNDKRTTKKIYSLNFSMKIFFFLVCWFFLCLKDYLDLTNRFLIDNL